MISKTKTLIAILLLGALGISALKAQEIECKCFVKGVVIDQHSKLPVPGVTVLIQNTSKGVMTDAQGRYNLSGLCPGKYLLIGKLLGYADFSITIDLKEGHEENFEVHEDEIHLKEVEISTQRVDAPITQQASSVTGRELDQTRGLSLGEALNRISGVSTLTTGSNISKPVIHGLHSSRILMINNGVRQEGQQWGSEHAPEIDPFVANRLQVIKGASGIRYGSDAIGGIILVEPAPLPYGKKVGGEFNLAGFSNGRQGVASGSVESGFAKLPGLAFRLQGTLKKGGNIRTPGYFLDNTGIGERNFSIETGYHGKSLGVDAFFSKFDSKIGIFSGSHIGSVTDLLQVIANGQPLVKPGFTYHIGRPYQDVNHELAKLAIHYNFAKLGRIQYTFARQYDYRAEYDLHVPRNDSLAALNRPELTFRLTTLTNDLVWDHTPIAQKLTGQIGISTLYQYNLMSGRPLIPNFDQLNLGVFWIERYFWKNWELEAGLRFDYRSLNVYRVVSGQRRDSEHQFHNATGTFGVNRKLSESWSVNVNIGTAWRAPNVSELYSNGVHHGAAAYEEGDASMGMEKALNSQLSIQFNQPGLRVELGMYHNRINGFIYLKPQPEPILTVRGAFPYFKYTQTNAGFTGADLDVTWEIFEKFTWISKTTFLRARDFTNDDYLVMIPPNRTENRLQYDFGNMKFLHNMSLGIGNQLVAQQKIVPANSDYLPPPKGYSLWNITLGSDIEVKGQPVLNVSLSATNLLNVTYRDYLNRFRYFADEAGRNISLRIKYSFGSKLN